MHYLHTLVSLIEKLTEGNRVAWILFIGSMILLGICLVHDLRANK